MATPPLGILFQLGHPVREQESDHTDGDRYSLRSWLTNAKKDGAARYDQNDPRDRAHDLPCPPSGAAACGI